MDLALPVFAYMFLFSPTPVMMAFIHEQEPEKLPFLNSIYMTINFLINSLITPAVGLFSDILGFYHAFQIAALIGIAAVPFGIRVPGKRS